MKSNSTYFLTIIGIFTYSLCVSQQAYLTPSEWVTQHKKTINNSTCIFEGKVIQQSTLKNTLWTCSIVQITKIFKGSPQVKLGTIKVLYEQGAGLQDAGPTFGKGTTYIIMGNQSDSKSFQTIIADNAFAITPTDFIVFQDKEYYDINTKKYVPRSQYDSLHNLSHTLIFLNRPIARWGNTKYSSPDSVYYFLKENGLTIQEEQK